MLKISVTAGTTPVNVFAGEVLGVLSVYNVSMLSIQIINNGPGVIVGHEFMCTLDKNHLTNKSEILPGVISRYDMTNIHNIPVVDPVGPPIIPSYTFRMYTGDMMYLSWLIEASLDNTDVDILIYPVESKELPTTFTGHGQVDTPGAATTFPAYSVGMGEAAAAYPAAVVAGTENILITTLNRALIIGGYEFATDSLRGIGTQANGATPVDQGMLVSGWNVATDAIRHQIIDNPASVLATTPALVSFDKNLHDEALLIKDNQVNGTQIAQARGQARNTFPAVVVEDTYNGLITNLSRGLVIAGYNFATDDINVQGTVDHSVEAVAARIAPVVAGTENNLITNLYRELIIAGYDYTHNAQFSIGTQASGATPVNQGLLASGWDVANTAINHLVVDDPASILITTPALSVYDKNAHLELVSMEALLDSVISVGAVTIVDSAPAMSATSDSHILNAVSLSGATLTVTSGWFVLLLDGYGYGYILLEYVVTAGDLDIIIEGTDTQERIVTTLRELPTFGVGTDTILIVIKDPVGKVRVTATATDTASIDATMDARGGK